MKKLAILMAALVLAALPMIGCQATRPGTSDGGGIGAARQALEDLPEPTFESLEVYVHDYSTQGIQMLVAKNPDVRIPLRIFSDSALSVLRSETLSMLDVIALSNSLDDVKEGKVKLYLDLGWTLLELNGVIRRDDVTATLTEREQRLLIALFQGIYLGTGGTEEADRILDGYGPRYGPASVDGDMVPPTGILPSPDK